jgi:hypothetical protein
LVSFSGDARQCGFQEAVGEMAPHREVEGLGEGAIVAFELTRRTDLETTVSLADFLVRRSIDPDFELLRKRPLVRLDLNLECQEDRGRCWRLWAPEL